MGKIGPVQEGVSSLEATTSVVDSAFYLFIVVIVSRRHRESESRRLRPRGLQQRQGEKR